MYVEGLVSTLVSPISKARNKSLSLQQKGPNVEHMFSIFSDWGVHTEVFRPPVAADYELPHLTNTLLDGLHILFVILGSNTERAECKKPERYAIYGEKHLCLFCPL